MARALHDFIKYSNFLRELVLRDFKKKYYKSVLGILWTVLNPLLMMTVVTIVFSTLFTRNIPHFPVYYLTGYILYNFCMTSSRESMHSILSNFHLIKKIYVPKYMFCLSTVIVQFITLLFSMLPLFLMMALLGVPLTPFVLLLPLPLLLLLIFTTGLSLILSAYAVYFRDLDHLFGIITTLWIYATPVFYPITIIPERFRFLWDLNPLHIYLTLARNVLLDGTFPEIKILLSAVAYSLLTLAMGMAVFHEKENGFFLRT